MGHKREGQEEAMWTKDEENWLEMKMEINTNRIIASIREMIGSCKENRVCNSTNFEQLATLDDLKDLEEKLKVTNRKNLQVIAIVSLVVTIAVATMGGPTAVFKLAVGRLFGLALN
jgi:hypothetical protein